MGRLLLEGPWQACFELAWEAFLAGTVPVGAVVVDAEGTIVARGRNRIFERTGPAAQIANSYVAHAEINALAQLPPGDYFEHTMLTTLEPCVMCTAALAYAKVGSVWYAAADELVAGANRLMELNDLVAQQWCHREGPSGGMLASLSALLHAAHFAWRLPEGITVQTYERTMPGILAAARSLLAASRFEELAQLSPSEAFDALGTRS